MKFILTLTFFFTSLLYSNVITISDKTNFKEVLSSSEIYIDKTRSVTIEDVRAHKIEFKNNSEKLLSYGYSPNFDVWIKFTIHNSSPNTIHRVLEYANPLTTNIDFYDSKDNGVLKDGLSNINKSRKTINPTFPINIGQNESKTYYLKVSSNITTLIIKFNLWSQKDFYRNELKHQVLLSLFFGAMMVLAIYNFFVFLFSKDISYLYYVLYIVSLSIHQLFYTGMAYIYLLNSFDILSIIQHASIIVAVPIISLALFFKSFLRTKQYKKLNTVLNILMGLIILLVIVITFNSDFNQYRNLLSIILLVHLFIITIHAVIKKNRQAYFILLSWLFIFIAVLFMYLTSIGVFNIYEYFAYLIEVLFIAEAIIFSIALSDKINSLQKEKNSANKALINQKKTENQRLEIQVQKKTEDLNISLDEKTLLLREVNHRVKNNMQMIVSLIRLQSNDISDIKMKNIFLTTQNRLNAMSQLHELLYQKDDVSYVNAYEYFTTLIEGLEDTYSDNINIEYKIDTDLQTEQAISSGIILNELVTNSLKYAFDLNEGCITIYLAKNNNEYTLRVKDNGKGFDKINIPKSFGLILVETLVSSKLEGQMITNTKNGVETTIIWRDVNE